MPTLTHFDPDTASDTYFRSRHAYQAQDRLEASPEDPPVSLAFSITNARSWKLVESTRIEVWHLWDDDKMIAELFINLDMDEENAHLLFVRINVLKAYRRRGYTRPLLEKVAALAHQYQRTLVMGGTSSRVPDGKGFAEHVGARRGLEERASQLQLAEVDGELIRKWLSPTEGAQACEIGFWQGRFPEEDLAEIATLYAVMNGAPRGELEMNDWTTTTQDLRQWEDYELARGVETWTCYARDRATRKLVGLTKTSWYPENPENLEQGMTGVLPEFTGRGLGRRLKAAMIEKVMRERQVVKRIRTENADANAPMLAINTALGFKLYKVATTWQLDVATLKNYLKP